MRISDWSSDVCSSDLTHRARRKGDQRRFDGRYRSAGEGDLSMFDLTGLTALVTGASGGIGSAIARGLAAQGARVALSGTREDALQAVAAAIGGDDVVLPCNMSDPADVDGSSHERRVWTECVSTC